VLQAVAEEVAKEAKKEFRAERHVDGVALENGHVVLYAADAFVERKRPGGGSIGPSDENLSKHVKPISELTMVDIFVSRRHPPKQWRYSRA
jgi:hypothetical protein